MGLPKFGAWFREQYKDVFVELEQPIDHLYIDVSSILHVAARKGADKGEEHFHKRLHRLMGAIMRRYKPRKSVMLALDGPAPLAKLLEQRSRREGTVRREARDGPISEVSQLGLTPGSIMMHSVHNSLVYYICMRLMTMANKHLVFEFSSSEVPGEGELKIISRLVRPWGHVLAGDTHAILGPDSDLVLLAMMSSSLRCSSLYVISGTEQNKAVSMVVLNRTLAAALDIAPSAGQDGQAAMMTGVRRDLVLLSIMACGNDYLPAVRGLDLSLKLQEEEEEESGRLRGLKGVWAVYGELWRQEQPTRRHRGAGTGLLVREAAGGGLQVDLEVLEQLLAHPWLPALRMSTAPDLGSRRSVADCAAYLQVPCSCS